MPLATIVIGGCAAVIRPHGKRLVSAFDHFFAVGMVFSVVAVELLPKLHEVDRPLAMILGFVAGVLAMMASKRWFEAAGTLVPTAVDLLIDGLLIAIGLAAGRVGGFVLLAGLAVEALSLGLSSTPAWSAAAPPASRRS
jgi:ZIP family zinc transporter